VSATIRKYAAEIDDLRELGRARVYVSFENLLF
jgi:hypothetical protein